MALMGFKTFPNNENILPNPSYIFNVLKGSSVISSPSISIGNRCLASWPSAAQTAETYFTDLRISLEKSEGNLEKDQIDYKNFLQKQIAQDFLDGRLLTVDGWFLSEFEAKHCTTVAWAFLKLPNYA